MSYAQGLGDSITTINGGNVGEYRCFGTSAMTITGGTVTKVHGHDTCTANITGGTITDGLLLISTGATVNFSGSGLSYVYAGYAYNDYGDNHPYGFYTDTFTVSGVFDGAVNSYTLHLVNGDGAGGTANPAPRQFTLNEAVASGVHLGRGDGR